MNQEVNLTVLEAEIKALEDAFFVERQKIKPIEKALIEKKTALRISTLKDLYEKFYLSQGENIRISFYLNNALLHDAVVSYYYDIHKYKCSSGSKWANSHKQAAYTIKWLSKFRPIQIKSSFDNEDISARVLDINLHFALFCGLSFLDRKVVDLIFKKVEGKSYYENLIYILRYRPFIGKQIVSIFEALELNANSSSV